MNVKKSKRKTPSCRGLIAVAMLSMALTGCQVNVGGQTLPSPYYLWDDIQYFAPGNEFQLENEAAAMQAGKQAAEELDALR